VRPYQTRSYHRATSLDVAVQFFVKTKQVRHVSSFPAYSGRTTETGTGIIFLLSPNRTPMLIQGRLERTETNQIYFKWSSGSV